MRKLLVVIFIIFLFGFVIFGWWKNGLSAVNPKNTTQISFVVPKGLSVREIGNELKAQNLIRDPVVFFVYVKLNSLDHGIQAGSYKLSPSMDLKQIMETLGHGTTDIWVTIPEGLRSEEVAAILQKNVPSYKPEWISALQNEEGYLFPDTYLIPKDADVATVIKILEDNFYQKIGSIGLSKNTPSLNKIIIKASLIEREAKFAEDRPNVASVINNRLDNGMALQIDATAQYAYGYNAQDKTWWKVPNASDLKIQSPYNTYINVGLPPGPICNPGLSAIKAAVNPADTSYIYYVNDSTGKLHFASTLAQHNQNVEQYLK